MAGTHAVATPASLGNDATLAGGGRGESAEEVGAGGRGTGGVAGLAGEGDSGRPGTGGGADSDRSGGSMRGRGGGSGGGVGDGAGGDGSGGDGAGAVAEILGEVGTEGAGGSDPGYGGSARLRFDTPPIPRRVDISISRREIPGNLRHIENSLVKFELLISEVGEVSEAKIVESTGYDEIDALLLEKIYTSWYHPATLRGDPVKAWIVVGYGYKVGR